MLVFFTPTEFPELYRQVFIGSFARLFSFIHRFLCLLSSISFYLAEGFTIFSCRFVYSFHLMLSLFSFASHSFCFHAVPNALSPFFPSARLIMAEMCWHSLVVVFFFFFFAVLCVLNPCRRCWSQTYFERWSDFPMYFFPFKPVEQVSKEI